MEMPNETYMQLIEQLDELVEVFENHPDPVTQEQAAALLAAVDMLHREGLGRLIGRIRAAGNEALLADLRSDPVVEVMLALYDLVDVELPADDPATRTLAYRSPVDEFLMQQRPALQWLEVATVDEIGDASMVPVIAGSTRALLVRLGGEIHGFRNGCGNSDLPLDSGRLIGDELVCPWHGCRYHVPTGARRDGGEGRLDVFPVAVRGASVQIPLWRDAAAR